MDRDSVVDLVKESSKVTSATNPNSVSMSLCNLQASFSLSKTTTCVTNPIFSLIVSENPIFLHFLAMENSASPGDQLVKRITEDSVSVSASNPAKRLKTLSEGAYSGIKSTGNTTIGVCHGRDFAVRIQGRAFWKKHWRTRRGTFSPSYEPSGSSSLAMRFCVLLLQCLFTSFILS